MNKKLSTILLICVLGLITLSLVVYAFVGANSENSENTENTEETTENSESHEDAEDYTWNTSKVISIELNNDSISANSGSVLVENSTATIMSAGTYSLSGTLTDGQIIIETEDKEVVKLILNGVNINCSYGAPIDVEDAKKVIIIVADNTENYITDGENYILEKDEDEPNAAIYSKSDLTIYGTGSGILNVNANYNDAIISKDGLIIKDAKINLTSIDDGVRGKDYLIIENSNITANVEGDGLKSDNSEDASEGYISIEDGNINIVSGGDAISAETDVIIASGEFNLTSGKGSNYGVNEDTSMKAIKAGVSVLIDNGNFVIDSTDDALHSNNNLTINGGNFAISSGDDGIHADKSIEINNGDIAITKSYEGIESALVTINNGNIYIVSSDDGINIAGGNDGSAMGRPGAGGFEVAENGAFLYINGGYVYVNANGDGIDSNGSVAISGGEVIVDGPTRNDNGALDYMGTFNITGGLVIAVGSSGMAQAPSASSTQNSVLININAQQTNSLINIQNSSGQSILTFSPAKQYQSIVFSSPEIQQGETYIVYLGGSSTGTETNGLYKNGSYSPGTQNTSFTVSSTVTNLGGMGGGMNPGMDRGMNRNMDDFINGAPDDFMDGNMDNTRPTRPW